MTPEGSAESIGESPSNLPNHDTSIDYRPIASSTRRARELYKYFQPLSLQQEQPTPISDHDILSSLAQLVSLRLKCRCLINLIDESHQYRVAEATLASAMGETDRPNENECDLPWEQCRLDVLENSICGYTINVPKTNDGTAAFFEVMDLSRDSRFAHKAFVHGPPYFRYYFGLPLRTKTGVPIGALAVVDSQLRPPMSKKQRSFLETIVANIMTYLDLELANHERLRSRDMNKILNHFVDPSRGTTDPSFHPPPPPPPPPPPTQPFAPESFETHRASANIPLCNVSQTYSASSPIGAIESHQSFSKNAELSLITHHLKSTDEDVSTPQSSSPAQNLGETESLESDDPFRRAADLLCQSLKLGDDGAVVFLDTASAITRPPSTLRKNSAVHKIDFSPITDDPNDDRAQNHDLCAGKVPRDACRVIASSASLNRQEMGRRPSNTESHSSYDFLPMCVEALSNLVRNNPQGKVWAPTEIEDCNSSHGQEAQSKRLRMEHIQLSRSFPKAAFLFMFPIWDARSSRWTALFAYSKSYLRAFSRDMDIPYMTSFANCISVELLRLATAAADRQKGNLIGSISHELRSPLHGILASCELLQDTRLSGFQQSFVDTANSCGRTLLDTINMILDYSKIHSVQSKRKTTEKNSSDGFRSDSVGPERHVLTYTTEPHGLANLTNVVDLAAIVEEVVEGAAISQAFQGLQHADSLDAHSRLNGQRTRDGIAREPRSLRSRKPIEILLDIADAPQSSWLYTTQPGAFRRIVMNLVGNAMKYTSEGWVKVSLKVTNLVDQKGEIEAGADVSRDGHFDTITFTVVDTGKGMTPEFLDTRAFLPFAQEDTLSPGIGLGLSMVKKLLHTLGGTINVQTVLNEGTTVIVTVPMQRRAHVNDSARGSSKLTPSSGGTSASLLGDNNADRLRKDAPGCQVAFFCQPAIQSWQTPVDEVSKITHLCLEEYVSRWFGLTMLTGTSFQEAADIFITEDLHLKSLLSEIDASDQSRHRRPCIVALCSALSRNATHVEHNARNVHIQFISKPFGPYKLAKALQACLDRSSFSDEDISLDNVHQAQQALREVDLDAPVVSELKRQGEHHLTQSGEILINEGSPNAKRALRDSQLAKTSFLSPLSETSSPAVEFPFPSSSTIIDEDEETKENEAAALDSQDQPPTPHSETGKHDLQLSGIGISKKVLSGALEEIERDEQRRSPRVLLVDDNLINLKILQTFMKKLKYPIFTSACNGAEACDVFDAALTGQEPYDVIFLDLSMPVLDGFEAARRIRASEKQNTDGVTSVMMRPAPVMIVALTGLVNESDQLQAFNAGVDLYMTKPARFKEVARVINSWMANGGTSSSDLLPHGHVSSMSIVT